ncbi:MAG: hypothetical protein R3B47_13875, partial [Bacteroidia bacterium]
MTTDGIYRTTDAGANWTQVETGSWRDVEFKPGDPSVVYATQNSTFWKSTDTGANFSQTYSVSGASRLEIGVSPANSAYVYLLAGPNTGSGSFKGVFRSTDSGATFSSRSTTPNVLGYSITGSDDRDQAWYDLAIAVHPSDANTVHIGGINQWKSTDGGSTWSPMTGWSTGQASGSGLAYTHADIHDLIYFGTILYSGNDGGIHKSTDHVVNWTNLTFGMQHGQMYRIAGTQSDKNKLLMGNQDEGSNVWVGPGQTNWTHIYGADGMDCMVDQSNASNIYFSTQSGGLRKSTNGGNSSSGIAPDGNSGADWVAPYVMDPNNSSIFYGAWGNDVYKNTNGTGATSSNWTSAVVGSATIRHLAIGTNNSQVVYAASSGKIWRSADGGSTWTDITNAALSTALSGSPNITRIAVDPADANQLWVTLSAFSSGNKVFESSDGGTTWTNYSGTLPNVPVNCIAYENSASAPNDALFIGTDVGVYYRDDS